MAKTLGKSIRTRTIALTIVLGAWSVALVIMGILFVDARWGGVCLGAGAACCAITGLGAIRQVWIAPTYGVTLVTAAGLIVVGTVELPVLIGFGVLGLVIVGASAPIAFVLADHAARGSTAGGAPAGMQDRLARIEEHTMLSDNAKRILFRERELGMLRDAIEDDIHHGKYNAALRLCSEMADFFGYREEAEAFRQRILQSRQEHFEAEAQTALDHFDELLAERSWARVHQEAARIRRLFGDSHLVIDLDRRIAQARDDHKQELEQRFVQAAGREDVEHAMLLLKELDRYLDPEEAERLSKTAEGVVVKHRHNLTVQFKLAVADHRWAEAARIGEGIIDEFPNSKMAGEVRSMIDLLRTRASQAAVVGEEDVG
jgi:hypothetical protein